MSLTPKGLLVDPDTEYDSEVGNVCIDDYFVSREDAIAAAVEWQKYYPLGDFVLLEIFRK
jgi:hypothetical protein